MSKNAHHSPPRTTQTPWNQDAERVVLSCALQAPEKTIDILAATSLPGRSDLFFDDSHAVIYRHLLALHEAKTPPTLLSLQARMRATTSRITDPAAPAGHDTFWSNDLELIGGPKTLAEIQTDAINPARELGPALAILREDQIRRAIIQTSQEALRFSHEKTTDLPGLLHSLSNRVQSLRIEAGRDHLAKITTAPSPLLDYLRDHSPRPGAPRAPMLIISAGDQDAEKLRVRTARQYRLVAVSEREIRAQLDPRVIPALAAHWCVILHDQDTTTAALALTETLLDSAPKLGIIKTDIFDLFSAIFGRDLGKSEPTPGQTRALVTQIHQIAETATGNIPADILWRGLIWQGNRGGLNLHEDILARRIVKSQRLSFIGGEYWRWNGPDSPQPGTWTSLGESSKEEIAALARSTIRQFPAPGGEDPSAIITDNKISSVCRLTRSDRALPIDSLNHHDPYLINTRSGMLHSLNGTLLPHAEEYFSTYQMPVTTSTKPRPCPNWLKWLADQQPDQETRDQIQEIFGYCLAPKSINYQKFFFFFGDGGSGKSTCVNTLIYLMGRANVASITPEDLDKPHATTSLVGKSLYYVPEATTSTFRNEGIIKKLASGEPIDVNPKYGKPFSYWPDGRLIMCSNFVAHCADTTEGFLRRFMQLTWDKIVPENERIEKFEEKFFYPEIDGIFDWALEGFRRLHARGRFSKTQQNLTATQEFQRHRSQVKSFINDNNWLRDTPKDNINYTTIDALYNHYLAWCDEYGVKRYYETSATFSKEVLNKRPDLKKRKERRNVGNAMGITEKATVFYGLELIPFVED